MQDEEEKDAHMSSEDIIQEIWIGLIQSFYVKKSF